MKVHLCFHGVGTCGREREPGESRYWMRESVFLDLLDALGDHPGVLLSFDDGNRSDVAIALPALRAHNRRATFFALAGRLDDPASVSAADLRVLRTSGMSIGSHGWSHVPWRGLSTAEAQREFVDARKVLEEASGGAVTEAALPLGRYDRESLRRLRKSGYRTVYTSDRYPARSGSWLQPRYSVTADDTVDSVMAIACRSAGLGDVSNLAKSLVKRVR
jgi:peptidoglycan/xylan/chitin deacetylase (PgdA/CDA1 family)